MARPLRIEYPGAVYHVTSRGDRRETIFAHDEDRHTFLSLLQTGMARFDARVLAYCLMGNHYHLVVQTHQANLSQLMRHLNGVYTQRFNRRHGKTGHVFQGRFKAVLVDRDAYLLEVCRYVDANPVRAGLVRTPDQWEWSSYRAHTGLAPAPDWLDCASVWAALQGHLPAGVEGAAKAAQHYRDLVYAARDIPPLDQAIRQQAFLGGEDFVRRMRDLVAAGSAVSQPSAGSGAAEQSAQSAPMCLPQTLADWMSSSESREECFARAYRQGRWTMTRIAAEAGLSVQHVSRLIARWERSLVPARLTDAVQPAA